MRSEAPVGRAKLVGLSHEEAARWEEAVEEAAIRIRRFLWTRLLLGAATALLYTAYLWIFGIDLLFTWALLALLLNFIPTIGSIIAGLLPALYALATKDPGTALAVAGGLLVIEQIMRSEEHTSELQSLMRTSYAVFCLKKKNKQTQH